MIMLPNLFNLSVVVKEDKNKSTVEAIFKERYNQNKEDIEAEPSIDIACDKAKELVALLDEKFPFFNKSILTTDICCIFATLYLCINKICDTLLQIIDTEDNKDAILSDRLAVDNLKEMRNLIDNKFKSPKNHAEIAIVAPLEDIQTRMSKDDFLLDYEDCAVINTLIDIVYLNIDSLLNNRDNTDDVLILGKDYKLSISNTEINITRPEVVEEEEEESIIEHIEEPINEESANMLVVKSSANTSTSDNALMSIMNKMVNIDNNVSAYKDIKASIDLKFKDTSMSIVAKDVINSISKTIKDTINTNLTPLENEISKDCSDALLEIKTLQDELVKYMAYINSIQKELKLSK